MYIYVSRLRFKIKGYIKQNNFKGSYDMPLNTTKRQHYLCLHPYQTSILLVSMLSCASQLSEPYLVNFHSSHKPWPGLTGWLMKSDYTAPVRRLKAKNSIRKEYYKCPVFQRILDSKTCFYSKKLCGFLQCVMKHYSHWDCLTQLICWKKSFTR